MLPREYIAQGVLEQRMKSIRDVLKISSPPVSRLKHQDSMGENVSNYIDQSGMMGVAFSVPSKNWPSSCIVQAIRAGTAHASCFLAYAQ